MTEQFRDKNDLRTDISQPTGSNPDAITGAPGSHPVGTGIGAAGAGAAGAAIGAIGGPIGIAIGAVVGAVAGGLAGKGVAESINPSAEDDYWRSNYRARPYYQETYSYEDDYQPAYRHGWEAPTKYQAKEFDEAEPQMAQDWEMMRGSSKLHWEHAKSAARDAWERVRQPGDTARGEQVHKDNVL